MRDRLAADPAEGVGKVLGLLAETFFEGGVTIADVAIAALPVCP